jgi:hypothetical protein
MSITLVWGDNKVNFELPAIGDIPLSSHDIAEVRSGLTHLANRLCARHATVSSNPRQNLNF